MAKKSMKQRVDELRSRVEVQTSYGNWNFDPYMHGMANGMIVALATMECDPDPVLLSAPDAWLSEPDENTRDCSGGVLPDGSAFCTAKMKLPDDHWIYGEKGKPPAPFRMGIGTTARLFLEGAIRHAAKYAVRGATMSGKDMDFDPDALVQNLIVGFLGYCTDDGTENGELRSKWDAFEVGKYYRHTGGEEIHIVGEVESVRYGECFAAESNTGMGLKAIAKDVHSNHGWKQISKEDFDKNFSD